MLLHTAAQTIAASNASDTIDASDSVHSGAATIGVPSSCAWWNLACKGGEHVANSGLSAITKSIASGAEMLLGQIVRIIDDSSAVPLADPTYRHVYFGFLGLAAPLIGIVLCLALVVASLGRDAGTLGRAFVGVGIASVGGALYIVFAQLLVAVDDWLTRGVVRVTGYNLSEAIGQIAVGFHNIAGAPGEMAANMLLILLMLIMLIAGLILWFVLVLRKIAILVVVAFAPLLIAGYLWAPTRVWVRRTTEVLVALVFTKTAIFTLFGIGLALLSRGGEQSLSDFVGTTVLMCGACFAPLMMLRLVHFAADSHLAGDAIGSLRGGVQPLAHRLGRSMPTNAMGRSDLARAQAQGPAPAGPEPAKASSLNPGATPASAGGTGPAGSGAAAGGAAATAATGGAAAAAIAAHSAAQAARATGASAAKTGSTLLEPSAPDRPLRGPALPTRDHSEGEPR
jgi:type IV secretion system protein TrbL